jgi:hypothetical protein
MTDIIYDYLYEAIANIPLLWSEESRMNDEKMALLSHDYGTLHDTGYYKKAQS